MNELSNEWEGNIQSRSWYWEEDWGRSRSWGEGKGVVAMGSKQVVGCGWREVVAMGSQLVEDKTDCGGSLE